MAPAVKIQGGVPPNSQRWSARAESARRGNCSDSTSQFFEFLSRARRSRLFDHSAFVARLGRPICIGAGGRLPYREFPMKPDRFEILVCLSGIAVAALIATAAFGMADHEQSIDSGSKSGNPPRVIFASAPNSGFAGPGFIRLSRESIVFPRLNPVSVRTPINIR
jgi:hypothetical protein